MGSYFVQELKRAFLSKKTFITCIISIALFFYGMASFIPHIATKELSILYVFLNGYNSGTGSFLILMFPLVAAIPYATSYIEDKRNGVNKYITMRMKRNYYLQIRLIVNGLVGGFALFIAPFTAMIFLLLMRLTTGAETIRGGAETLIVFQRLGVHSVEMMMLTVCLLLFCCGFTIATLTLGLSTIIKNVYLTVLAPFLLLLFSGIILATFSPKLNLMALYDIHNYFMPMSERIIYYVIVLIIGISLYFIRATRVDAYDN